MGVDWLSLGGLLFTALSTIFGVWKYVGAKMEKERDDRIEEIKEERKQRAEQLKGERHDRELQVAALQAETRSAHIQMNDLRVHIAETYATKEVVEASNKQVMGAINDLGRSIDKRLDRMDVRLDRAIDGNVLPRGGHAD